MIAHYFALALRNLSKSPMMSAALLVALALGVGASMTMLTVVRVMSWDPLPGRSAQLYHPFIDPLPLTAKPREGSDPRISLTWVDAKALLDGGPADGQVALASGRVLLPAQSPGDDLSYVEGQFATSRVFDLFGIQLLQGSGWTDADDADHANVIVLSASLARRLASQAPLVGQQITLSGHGFRIVGIAADWLPAPRFHTDMQRDVFAGKDDFFIPLETAIALGLEVRNAIFSWGDVANSSNLQGPSATWLQFWIKLDSDRKRDEYSQFLQGYVQSQADSGRFQRPQAPAILSLRAYLQARHIVPAEVKLQLSLALAFLFVCVVNICALLYARLSRRNHEIAIRRALGARRVDIVLQLVIEALLIGALGGGFAVLVAESGLWFLRTQPDGYAALAVMDLSMVLVTLVMACVCSFIAAGLPALRAASTRIVMQMKAAQ
ncbi:ABC transporter permease [uncultured Stenotrophomonas sp.]|uniref:ABC transporter permease n=1 Tax=uncultured Stenotrophomonas sp. TaxID=165438 RepID=UPI0025F41CAD|nr:ABC transporter permease [uncultured Stenotrophomonas sp.]